MYTGSSACPHRRAIPLGDTSNQMLTLSSHGQLSFDSFLPVSSYGSFVPKGKPAYPTSRLLDGQWAQSNLQEWAEHGRINNDDVTVYYLFTHKEAETADCEIYGAPFDAAHVDRIVLS